MIVDAPGALVEDNKLFVIRSVIPYQGLVCLPLLSINLPYIYFNKLPD